MNYITPVYAAGLALFFVALSVRTLLMRRKYQIAVGDGDNPQLLRAMRVHANFAEYTPLALLLIYMLESSITASLAIHALCLCLVVGRASHAFGVSQVQETYFYRVFGMAMTFTVIGFTALGILARELTRYFA